MTRSTAPHAHCARLFLLIFFSLCLPSIALTQQKAAVSPPKSAPAPKPAPACTRNTSGAALRAASRWRRKPARSTSRRARRDIPSRDRQHRLGRLRWEQSGQCAQNGEQSHHSGTEQRQPNGRRGRSEWNRKSRDGSQSTDWAESKAQNGEHFERREQSRGSDRGQIVGGRQCEGCAGREQSTGRDEAAEWRNENSSRRRKRSGPEPDRQVDRGDDLEGRDRQDGPARQGHSDSRRQGNDH